ncbi:MAG: hypothetical protein DRH49_07980 [Candidatus Coatesbacteria bacterium]|nr:MAG: hypothetical protein DRH49_07980 [Candidatus Coatesbacteria bacterium]
MRAKPLIVILYLVFFISCDVVTVKPKTCYLCLRSEDTTFGYIEYTAFRDSIEVNKVSFSETDSGIARIHFKETIMLDNHLPIFIRVSQSQSKTSTEVFKLEDGWYIRTTNSSGTIKRTYITEPLVILDPAYILPIILVEEECHKKGKCLLLNLQKKEPTIEQCLIKSLDGNHIAISYDGNSTSISYNNNNPIPTGLITNSIKGIRSTKKPKDIEPVELCKLYMDSISIFAVKYTIQISGAELNTNILSESPQKFTGECGKYILSGRFNLTEPTKTSNYNNQSKITNIVSSYIRQYIPLPADLPHIIAERTGLSTYKCMLKYCANLLKKRGYHAREAFGLAYCERGGYLAPHHWLEVLMPDNSWLAVDPHPLFTSTKKHIRLIAGDEASKANIISIEAEKMDTKPLFRVPLNLKLAYELRFEGEDLGCVKGSITPTGEDYTIEFSTDTLWSRGEGRCTFRRGEGTIEYVFTSLNDSKPITEESVEMVMGEGGFIISPANPLLLYQLASKITGEVTPVSIRPITGDNIYKLSIVHSGFEELYIDNQAIETDIYTIPQLNLSLYIDRWGRIIQVECPHFIARIVSPIPVGMRGEPEETGVEELEREILEIIEGLGEGI